MQIFYILEMHKTQNMNTNIVISLDRRRAAYSFFPKKPSIKIDIEETNPNLIAQLNQPKLIAA